MGNELIIEHRVHLLAPRLDLLHVLDAEAVCPLGERDLVVVVGVAAVEKVSDAVLQSLEGRAHREQLVAGHRRVRRLQVQRAPPPHRRVRPTLRLIRL